MIFYPIPFFWVQILMISVINCVKNTISLEKTNFEDFAQKISTLMKSRDVLISFTNRYRKIEVHKIKNEKSTN
jgi:hypothetical protein